MIRAPVFHSQFLIIILSCSLVAAAVIDIDHTTTAKSMSVEKLEKKTGDAITMTSTSATPIDITTPRSEVKKFIRRVQSTLERAEPFLDEVEKEAKRLEQTAKHFGEGLIRSFKGIMGRILGSDGRGGIPSIFGIIRIGGNQGNFGIKTKQVEPCETDIKATDKIPKSPMTTSTTEETSTIREIALKNSTKIELSTTTTTKSPDIFLDIVEDANTFDNEI